MSDEYPPTINCPFCNDDDYDLIGLKMHLLRGWCEKFDTLKVPPGVMDLTKRKQTEGGGENV